MINTPNFKLLPNNILVSFDIPDYLQIDSISNILKIAPDDFLSTDINVHNQVITDLMSIFAQAIGAVTINKCMVEEVNKSLDINKGDILLCGNTQNDFMINQAIDIDWNENNIYFVTEFSPTKFPGTINEVDEIN